VPYEEVHEDEAAVGLKVAGVEGVDQLGYGEELCSSAVSVWTGLDYDKNSQTHGEGLYFVVVRMRSDITGIGGRGERQIIGVSAASSSARQFRQVRS
jgi:hypothetical protein